MAIAIPLIASYGAAALGATAATAAVVGIGAGLVAGATGISAKVDKAASKVFGRDAVKAFNIAGTIYGAMGGFSGQGPSQVWDNVTGAFAGAPSGASAANPTPAPEVGPDGFPNGMAGQRTAVGSMDGLVQGEAAQAGSSGIGDRISQAWKGLGDKGQAAVIQVGGQMLAGVAQGKAQQAELDAAKERDRLYRSGSGRPWGGRVSPAPGALSSFNDFYAKPAGG